jgi:hypothetical protein|tara:strand:+ start:3163 stop:3939 length:777 start_codon:yes stop_codon:yes gene_type:complete
MKNFNKKIYGINRKDMDVMDTIIPKDYFKMASKIANSFSKDYSAIGVMNINDLNQESYLALIKSWKNINWKYINTLETQSDRNKTLSKYLSISVKGLLGDRIKDNIDGTNRPIKGIWNNKDKKRYTTGFGFISILFPHWFDSDIISMIDDEVYDYDYDKLGEYLENWLKKYLPKQHAMMGMFYGLDDIYSKPKKMAEIGHYYGMNTSSVRRQKQRLLHRLRNNEDALNELAYYVSTNGVRSQSMVHDYAAKILKIYRD